MLFHVSKTVSTLRSSRVRPSDIVSLVNFMMLMRRHLYLTTKKQRQNFCNWQLSLV